MESHFNQRWYKTNHKGEHTFFIEVFSSTLVDELFFNTSLPMELFSKPGVIGLVKKLCKKDISTFERNNIAEKLIVKIERISAVQKYFFSDNMLDKNGKYCEAYVSTLNQLKNGLILKEFTPYSPFSNEAVFRDFQNSFVYEELIQESIRIDKNVFEACINGNIALQQAYTDIYCENSEYFFHSSATNGICMAFYCVVDKKVLSFIYFTKLQEINTVIL